jgi:hypothetical protein
MKRIIWHWTAGAYGLNSLEADSYHFVIQPDGKVEAGLDPVSANVPPLRPGAYAAHTLNMNSNSIGIALDAMAAAVERPFNAGRHPITEAQVTALVNLTAKLAMQYGIPVTRQTILSHAEVQPTLGVKQRAKWDIAWLPGMAAAGDPVVVGDGLRARVVQAMGARLQREPGVALSPNPVAASKPPQTAVNEPASPGFWASFGR